MTAFNIFLVLIVIVCFLLMLVVMAQNPKGGGLSSTFGSNTQVVGGVKKTGDFLEKSTWTFAGLLIILILVANTMLNTGTVTGDDSKLIDGNTPTQNVLPTNPLEPNTTTKTSE